MEREKNTVVSSGTDANAGLRPRSAGAPSAHRRFVETIVPSRPSSAARWRPPSAPMNRPGDPPRERDKNGSYIRIEYERPKTATSTPSLSGVTTIDEEEDVVTADSGKDLEVESNMSDSQDTITYSIGSGVSGLSLLPVAETGSMSPSDTINEKNSNIARSKQVAGTAASYEKQPNGTAANHQVVTRFARVDVGTPDSARLDIPRLKTANARADSNSTNQKSQNLKNTNIAEPQKKPATFLVELNHISNNKAHETTKLTEESMHLPSISGTSKLGVVPRNTRGPIQSFRDFHRHIRRGGAFLFLVFSPAFLVFSFSFLFLFFSFSSAFEEKKSEEKYKKSEEKKRKV